MARKYQSIWRQHAVSKVLVEHYLPLGKTIYSRNAEVCMAQFGLGARMRFYWWVRPFQMSDASYGQRSNGSYKQKLKARNLEDAKREVVRAVAKWLRTLVKRTEHDLELLEKLK